MLHSLNCVACFELGVPVSYSAVFLSFKMRLAWSVHNNWNNHCVDIGKLACRADEAYAAEALLVLAAPTSEEAPLAFRDLGPP